MAQESVKPRRRPIFLVAAYVIGVATVVGARLAFGGHYGWGIGYSPAGAAVLAVWVVCVAGVPLALVLLIVAGLRREGPDWSVYLVLIIVLTALSSWALHLP